MHRLHREGGHNGEESLRTENGGSSGIPGLITTRPRTALSSAGKNKANQKNTMSHQQEAKERREREREIKREKTRTLHEAGERTTKGLPWV